MPSSKKLSTYDVKIGGATINATVVDNKSLVEACVSEFFSALVQPFVVGFDVICNGHDSPTLCILCVGTQYLLFHFRFVNTFAFLRLLPDEHVSYVGSDMKTKEGKLSYYYLRSEKKFDFVDVGFLAATILKNPNLLSYNLPRLAREVGVDIDILLKAKSNALPHWRASVFSGEQVKLAIQEAYACYKIGKKLF